MKLFTKLLILYIIINTIYCILKCPETNNPPQEITIDETKTINPINFKDKSYNSIKAGNKIFLTEDYPEKIGTITSGLFDNEEYCPEDFIIPYKEDFEEVIASLGSDAYSFFTDENGLNMKSGIDYLTNTKGTSDADFAKIIVYIEDNTIKFKDDKPFFSTVRCMLKIPKIKLIAPFTERDLELNEKITIQLDSKYINGFLWKIDENIFETENVEYTFEKSREHKLEVWGKYINETDFYFCEIIYVNKKRIESSQTFSDSKIKIIDTDFTISYENSLHFIHSNCPIAPRDNGGYYVAFSDINKFLHILSYDNSDNLLKDFNTTENAYPHDITATDYGLAKYMINANNVNHSYINLYDKNFVLIKKRLIMNNDKNDNYLENSNLNKQIIRYDSSGNPVFGMRFMYRPDNGKLIYSRGRIFLIFAHYNYFLDNGGHTGDTIVTFDDNLEDMDFGITWGASHSLIQSATFDNNYFWTAALSDAYPEGINVEYTSKREFTSSYDSVNKKYNERYSIENDDLAGYIKGYHTGPADGKLGGILYFETYELYCLVYAKTPNYSDDPQKNNKTIIYITTWKFENKIISNERTYEIKVFDNIEENVMQLRAGKFGDDQIIIIYGETNLFGNNNYGKISKGTKPKLFLISVTDMSITINDKEYDNLLMNTNEDLRTFRDGVLIWGAADIDGKLIIHKIGTPSLTDSDEDDLVFEQTATIGNEQTDSVENKQTDSIGNKQTDTIGNKQTDSVENKQTDSIGNKQTDTIGNITTDNTNENGDGDEDNKSRIIYGIKNLVLSQIFLALEFIL